MRFRDLPEHAAWRHHDARAGFEVVFLHSDDGGHLLQGDTAALEDGEAWTVSYAIVLDAAWMTREVRVSARSASGAHELTLESDAAGSWLADGARAPQLDGCLDVDLESSALTNALPIHRLALAVGEEADAPAAYIRAGDLRVERLDQRYVRLPDAGAGERYHYSAPSFGFQCRLTYDASGLVLDYPGIAVRAG
jgi:hypothetical protein